MPLAEEPAIETYPLGTPQCGGLHIVGTLDDGDAQTLEVAVGTGILVGREQDEVGIEADDALAVRGHGTAYVADAASGQCFADSWIGDVLCLANSYECIEHAQLFDEAAMGGSEGNSTGELGVIVYCKRLQQFVLIPRTMYQHFGVILVFDEGEVLCIA